LNSRTVLALVACLAFGFFARPAVVMADDLTDVGYVDQAALANIPAFSKASSEVGSYKEQLDRQLSKALTTVHGTAEQQRLVQEYSGKLDERRRALLEPLLARAQTAIASVASSKNLSIVIDKRIVITGGQEITRNVIDLLTGIGDPVAPVSTPPPSVLGFVDHERIDKIPMMKSAMDGFTSYRAREQQRAEDAMRTARTALQKETLLKEYQKRLTDRQKGMIDPLLDRTRGAIADVAKKKRLILVIDRGDVMYGGADITGDVIRELGG
jgi:outer membrane protein